MTLLPLDIKESDSIAIIAPHPDDECIGAGGVISLYAKQCDIYIVSDGSRGNNINSAKTEREIRYRQFIEEMKYAEVNSYCWLGYEDGTLISQPDCLASIDFSKYSILFLPYCQDDHPDHMAVYSYAITELNKQQIETIKVYQYEVHNPMRYCSHYLDISDAIQKKIQLVKCHKDQIEIIPYDKMVNDLACYRAGQMGIKNGACEVFYLTNILCDEIPNENQDRERAVNKYKQLFYLFCKWLKVTDDSRIGTFLLEQGILSASIYGYADAGKCLHKQLRDGGIKIKDVFDKKRMKVDNAIGFAIAPSDGDRNVDTVIITVIDNQKDIENELLGLGYKNILTIQEILDQLVDKK